MDKLRFIAISGTIDVTENLYVYEYMPDHGPAEIIVLDCGVGFPEEATFGVDLVIPDFSYLVKNKEKIKGVFISHAHEDHFGAIPFLLDVLPDVKIYSSKLVAGFIEDKLLDYGIRGKKVNIVDPEGGPITAGSFIVDAFRITHSVPDSLGFSITSPVGRAFHVPDFKFDWTPVDGKPFDIAKAANLAKGGVLFMASDSLGATSEGYTMSEIDIEKNIAVIIKEAKGRIFFTTISSNISRMQQAINICQSLGKKVVFIGRSIERKAEIARVLGHLTYDNKTVISVKQSNPLPSDKILYLVSGCYGQVGSALYRIGTDEHQFLKIKPGDVVIFSADPAPPGTGQTTNYVVDNLIEKGAEVHYYDTQEDLHVSGHGSQKDIEMLLALVRPKYLVPIGGTIRHNRLYSALAQKMGWEKEQTLELKHGDVVEFTRDGKIKNGEHIPVKSLLVDGLGLGDVGEVVLSDRKTLAKEGVVIVVMQTDRVSGNLLGEPELISRGFVFMKENKSFLERAGAAVANEIRARARRKESRDIKHLSVEFLERFFFEETGRRPMILPVVVES
ncbi:MAG: ribonuclease J [Candidatus Blackburnbacteria bacterium]|nr:ribonuclease J [Candidatus Blackburnbacteria bacterium]